MNDALPLFCVVDIIFVINKTETFFKHRTNIDKIYSVHTVKEVLKTLRRKVLKLTKHKHFSKFSQTTIRYNMVNKSRKEKRT